MFNKGSVNAIQKACCWQKWQRLSGRKTVNFLLACFQYKFSDECQERSVPAVLRALVAFVLDVPAATEQLDSSQKQAVLTISQLLAFNCRRFQENNLRSRGTRKERLPCL
ncbi:hypothetical protein PoB_005169800 [Plakobranchus ocellatus]|uniref:Rho-GAP domain-containing protein n=1 Tax=Plakobranchus ocellatus TaxID=259542 RepID=A0AAV4BZY6_9GAST|nr:hypothetical protein PoB_005169800 [Plakobranchus ocellatus]